MLDLIRQLIVDVINAVYYFLADTAGLRFLDTPGTYLMIMVIGFMIVPFFSKNIYRIYANPHEHEKVSLLRKTLKGLITIGTIIFFGYANFTRFI